MTKILRYLKKPLHDEKLPDGFVRAGWRKVQKGGFVLFQRQHRQSDDLLPYVGAFVFCQIEDMWALTCTIQPTGNDWEDYRNFCRGRPSNVIVPENKDKSPAKESK